MVTDRNRTPSLTRDPTPAWTGNNRNHGEDGNAVGGSWDKAASEAMLRGRAWWVSFQVGPGSSFVSGDGRFAAFLRTFSSPDAGMDQVPAASLPAFSDGKIVWDSWLFQLAERGKGENHNREREPCQGKEGPL